MAKAVSESDFESEVLNSDVPVLVDFWASWCGPCKALAPTLDRLSEENDDAKVVKVDIEENDALSNQYGIRSLPTMLLFKNGEVVGSLLGNKPQAEIQKLLDEHL